jgi:hypothetical protein
VNCIISGTIQKNTKGIKSRRLWKTHELKSMWLTRKKHLEGMRRHHDEEAHEWGPLGADRPTTSSTSALLLEASSTAYENQSKPHIEVGLILRRRGTSTRLYKQTLDPLGALNLRINPSGQAAKAREEEETQEIG